MKEKNLLTQENVNETSVAYEAPFVQVEEIMVEKGFANSSDEVNEYEGEI